MEDTNSLCDHGVLGAIPLRAAGLVATEHFTLLLETPTAGPYVYTLHDNETS